MPTARCAFCGHDNPAASHFCNECGAALHLTLCGLCEAVNDRSAIHCHKCGAALESVPSVEATVNEVVEHDLAAEVLSMAAAEPNVVPGRAPTQARTPSRRVLAITAVLLVAIASAAIYSINRTLDSTPVADARRAASVESETPPTSEAQNADAAAAKDGEAIAEAPPAAEVTSPALAGADDGVVQGKSETSETADVAKTESEPEQAIASPLLSTTPAGKAKPARPPEKRLSRDAIREAGPPSAPLLMPARPLASARLQTPRNCTDAIAALDLCNRNADESR